VDHQFERVFLKDQIVIENASNGKCGLCKEAMDIFAEAYGAEAGVLGLKCKPYGGLYITGSLTRQVLQWIEGKEGPFMEAFTDKGMASHVLSQIPVFVVHKPDLGVRGAFLKAVRLLMAIERQEGLNDMRIEKRCFVLISGKRGTGKDFTGGRLKAALWSRGLGCLRLAMADEMKRRYAEKTSTDFYRLMKDRQYKEQHRKGITQLRRDIEERDRAFFHRMVIRRSFAVPANVVIVTDTRTPYDIQFFKDHEEVLTMRISASEEIRKERGWDPDPEKDLEESEVGLDDYTEWDHNFDSTKSDTDELQRWIDHVIIPKICERLGVTKEFSFVDKW